MGSKYDLSRVTVPNAIFVLYTTYGAGVIPGSIWDRSIQLVCLSLCLSMYLLFNLHRSQALMKFGRLPCFVPRMNAIKNGSDRTNFSTTPNKASYFDKPLFEKIFQIWEYGPNVAIFWILCHINVAMEPNFQ